MKFATWFLVLLPGSTARLSVLPPEREHFALRTALLFTAIALGVIFGGVLAFVFLAAFWPVFWALAAGGGLPAFALLIKTCRILRRLDELDTLL